VTRDHVETAIREGIPFVVKMADGRQYEVTDKHSIALGGAYIMLVDKDDLPHVLPLLTMTGISYLKPTE
jgi:hypothetical protein